MGVCPICRKQYEERPAISRKDGRTEICPVCGMREAIDSIPAAGAKKEEMKKEIEKIMTGK